MGRNGTFRACAAGGCVIEEILSRLDRVRKTGSASWIACCPAHDDRSPSMTLKEIEDGRVLAHCFSGCHFQEIVDATGLGWDVWFPEKTEHSPSIVKRPFPAGDVLEALSQEALLVAVTACNVANGIELSKEDKDRLLLAYQRIEQGRILALGQRDYR